MSLILNLPHSHVWALAVLDESLPMSLSLQGPETQKRSDLSSLRSSPFPAASTHHSLLSFPLECFPYSASFLMVSSFLAVANKFHKMITRPVLGYYISSDGKQIYSTV